MEKTSIDRSSCYESYGDKYFTGSRGICRCSTGWKDKFTFIVILISIFVLFTVLFFTNRLGNEMHTQLEQNLKDVVHQNELALKNQIHNNELLLKGMASELLYTDNEAKTIKLFCIM